jgi:D-alanyl-D-alanine carboxypeptidase/D-alanyl-D-alanine-endopeptidase (penicillin-binding protein 4)
LSWYTTLPGYPVFLRALPVLGRDGTLYNIQTTSPAAGHIFAKTGTFASGDPLNRNLLVTAKGLAGYITTANGRHLVFAVYVNNVAVPTGDDVVKIVGQAVGEVAASAY